jgi:hypothetical protein
MKLNGTRNGRSPGERRAKGDTGRHGDGRQAAAPAPPARDDPVTPMSDADRRHLAEYQTKVQLVRARVVAMVRGRATGLCLWGPGGTGKSHAVLGSLRAFQTNYRIHNSRMDGRGLFPAAPAAETAPLDASVAEGVGSSVGPYRLMEQVGEGGMGHVFVAEQLRPVRRKVALKVIKPGMDTRRAVYRSVGNPWAVGLPASHPSTCRLTDSFQ